MKDQKKMWSVFSLKHVLVVSLALNVGLIFRVLYEGEKNLSGFCLENKEAFMAEADAHVSKNTSLVTSTAATPTEVRDGVIDLGHGDPTMYERFWKRTGDKTTVVISGWQSISYFSDVGNICWFLEPEFANVVVRLHRLVGNAVTEDRHVVVGTGSSQLFLAVLYALSPPNASEPMDVVSAAPFYSSYPLMTDFLKSGLYKWAGDAHKYGEDRPYIELVTSPNNPDGLIRQAVVNRSEGILVHDLAYYWPQYAPISSPADQDIMLFTVSKTTGHAGSRIGWALVKDEDIAKKMTKFIELNTIGVSKDSQLRAAKILQAVADSYDNVGCNSEESETFFDYGYNVMKKRWKQLREAVNKSSLFSLPDFPLGTCTFSGRTFKSQPAFAWLKCEGEIEDCENFLQSHKVVSRGGKHFGDSTKYVRICTLSRDETFNLFIERLSTIKTRNSYTN
ncbi:unnamed protein product [Ilex paraguariensis]|uniref:Alliinase C-terminal domain-containing protein n=1 Tax=Ilex paraguariensis TaxID=185542 RepID=A0ABC8R1X0_9AQUA